MALPSLGVPQLVFIFVAALIIVSLVRRGQP